MAHQRIMQRLARWHIWLGWVVALPILLWTITGLVMAARPLEEVRGEHLITRAAPAAIDLSDLTLPRVGEDIAGAQLIMQADGPIWVVDMTDGGRYRYSGSDGRLIPPLIAEEARSIAEATYAGDAEFESARYFAAEDEPLELRRGIASWQVQFTDGTRIYLDDATGEVLATRTGWWRVYDLMYGLHIMAPVSRSDSHHPLLIGLTILSIIGSLLGTILLFRRRKARIRT